MDNVVSMYNSGKTHEQILNYLKKNIDSVSLNITNENNEYVDIEIVKNVDIFTPGLNVILSNPYKATIKRVLPYE